MAPLRLYAWFGLLLLIACSSNSKAVETNEEVSAPAKIKPQINKDKAQKDKAKTATPRVVSSSQKVHVSRVDRQRRSRTMVKGPRSAKLKWVFRTEGRVYADVAVGRDGTLLVPSHDGRLYAVGKDGRQVWSFDAEGKIWSSPAVAADGSIYFGSDADKFFALSGEGETKWIFSTKGPPQKKRQKDHDSKWDADTAPVIAEDGTIYFACHYFLYALRPEGDVRWRFQAGVGRVKIFSSPAIGHKGNIYFGTQGKRLFALDQNSNVLWDVQTGGDNDATPVVGDDDSVYFGSDDGKVRALKGASGETIWESAVGAPVRGPLALGHDGTVFAVTYGTKPFVAALDGKTGEERWRYHIEEGEGAFYGIQSGVLVDGDGFLYFGGRDHYVYCLSPKGKLVWRYETGDQVDSSPVLGPDGTLYIGSDDKRVYAFSR